MATGVVKWFSDGKGFGFIKPDDGSEDVFAHHSAVVKGGMTTLVENQKVQYETERGPKGLRAKIVYKFEGAPVAQEDGPPRNGNRPNRGGRGKRSGDRRADR